MRFSDCISDVCSSDLPLVELARVDALGEIIKARERPAPLARVDKIAHRLLADALQRAKRIANGKPFRVPFEGEIGAAMVDARREAPHPDRKSVESGKGVEGCVDLGGRRILKK